MKSIQEHRNIYANFIVRSAGSSSQPLIAAFSSTAREHYLGPGPWPIFMGSGRMPTLSEDPRLLYQDVLVGLATDRGIYNGQPTLHARCLAACAPVPGDTVVHVGAGTGYYTAILAALVGAAGSIVAYEIEADLAARARENLKHLPSVHVVAGSASDTVLPSADVIYVNAGATHPPATWLDALKAGGRLIFPLTPNEGGGVMLLVTHRGSRRYAASAVARVAFIPCMGARDDSASKALTAALETRSMETVKSLRRDVEPDSTAWCVGTDWWLSTEEPG